MDQYIKIMKPGQEFWIRVFTALLWDQITESERAWNRITANENNNEVFSAIHHFLIHVSNIVKILQPNCKDDNDPRKKRAKGIFANYPQLPTINPKDIHIRNHLEHFDERIDEWIKNSKHHNFADKNIGDIGPAQAITGLDSKDSFRWFVPKEKIIHFGNDQYHLEDLWKYVQEVKRGIMS